MASKRKRVKFYAVRSGRVPGVYEKWEDAEAQVCAASLIAREMVPRLTMQVIGFPGSLHKAFETFEEAAVSPALGDGREGKVELTICRRLHRSPMPTR